MAKNQTKGGKARAEKLTQEERSAIAKLAATARWKRTAEKKTPSAELSAKPRRHQINLAEFCRTMALAFRLPKEFYERPAILPELVDTLDIMDIAAARAAHVVQLGAEVGLPPAQALAFITMRYGTPAIGGDAQLAIVLDSGKAAYVKEYTEGEMYVDGQVNMAHAAICETLRAGDDAPKYGRFTVQEAHDAELWNRGGSWKTHKPRMLKYKARAFCLRDTYPDVLKGLSHSTEEMEGERVAIPRTGATDISPREAAQKLAGLLDKNALYNTTPALNKEEPHE